jgi:hypothetical protein
MPIHLEDKPPENSIFDRISRREIGDQLHSTINFIMATFRVISQRIKAIDKEELKKDTIKK